jgi:hypothetical protein
MFLIGDVCPFLLYLHDSLLRLFFIIEALFIFLMANVANQLRGFLARLN